MSYRITAKDLEGAVADVCMALGLPYDTREPGALSLALPNGHASGYRVEEVPPDGKGSRFWQGNSERLPARELWRYLSGIVDGVRIVRKVTADPCPMGGGGDGEL